MRCWIRHEAPGSTFFYLALSKPRPIANFTIYPIFPNNRLVESLTAACLNSFYFTELPLIIAIRYEAKVTICLQQQYISRLKVQTFLWEGIVCTMFKSASRNPKWNFHPAVSAYGTVAYESVTPELYTRYIGNISNKVKCVSFLSPAWSNLRLGIDVVKEGLKYICWKNCEESNYNRAHWYTNRLHLLWKATRSMDSYLLLDMHLETSEGKLNETITVSWNIARAKETWSWFTVSPTCITFRFVSQTEELQC